MYAHEQCETEEYLFSVPDAYVQDLLYFINRFDFLSDQQTIGDSIDESIVQQYIKKKKEQDPAVNDNDIVFDLKTMIRGHLIFLTLIDELHPYHTEEYSIPSPLLGCPCGKAASVKYGKMDKHVDYFYVLRVDPVPGYALL